MNELHISPKRGFFLNAVMSPHYLCLSFFTGFNQETKLLAQYKGNFFILFYRPRADETDKEPSYRAMKSKEKISIIHSLDVTGQLNK